MASEDLTLALSVYSDGLQVMYQPPKMHTQTLRGIQTHQDHQGGSMDRVQLGCITAGIREKTGFNCSSILGPKPYAKGTWLRKEEKAHPEPKK